MKFVNHIVLRLLLPLFFGMCILGALTIIVIFGQSPLWISRITDAIKAQAINGFVSTSATQANAVNAAFASYLISTVVATSYVRDVLQNPGSTPDTVIPVNRTYPSYFAAPLSGGDPPLPPAFAIPRYSSYYKGSITELSQWSAIASNDTTSTFDNPFRAITLDNAGAQAIQAGFEDDGWRIYPLSYDVTRFNPRTQTSCQRPDSPPQFAAFNGYNPRCRPWYYTAVQAAARNQSESIRTGLGPAVLSAPYVSQASSGRALITASQAFYNSTGVVGVIGLQVQIDNLNDQLTNTTILKNGYIFVVDVNGFLVLYPRKNAAGVDPFTTLTKLSAVEYANDDNAASRFIDLAQASAKSNGNIRTFTRKAFASSSALANLLSGDEWTISASYIPSTFNTYILIVAVPSSDITALSEAMRVSATTYANGALAGALIAIIVAAIIAILVTKNVARRVLVPVEELTDWLSGVASSNMDTEVADAPVTSHELRVVKQNFQNLLIAIRFGNDAYYAGDLSKALANYEAAEELMIQLSNERGRGVCLNNKGNVFMQMDEGQIGRAVEAYNKAIDIAETLLEGEMDPHHKTTIQITLANRISNLGVVYKDSEQSPSQNLQSPIPFTPKQEKANHFFKRSLDLHRGCDNLEGIAQVSGNLGQLHLDAGKIVEASELIRDAYDIVKDRSDPIAMQYACMNMGLLAIHIGKPAEAVTWFTYVLQRFDVVVNLVQRTCAMEIVRLCEETDPAIGVNQPELARAIREVAVPVLGDIFSSGGVAKPKDLHFVLDCSGSMAGNFIRACRSSIESIIREDCRLDDRISLTTFQNVVKEVFSLTQKQSSDNAEKLIATLNNKTVCDGSTAFYDALLSAVRKTSTSTMGSGPSNSTSLATRRVWLVALTDGDDNSSHSVPSQVAAEIRKNPNVGLIVITVGKLGNEPAIRELVAAANASPSGGGILLKADQSSEGIREAFGKVARMIVGDLKVESL